MAEEKPKTTLDKIEELIVDGQKEVLERIDKVEERLDNKIDGVSDSLSKKIDAVHTSLKKEISVTAQASYGLLTDVRNDVKQVDEKLEKHLKVPHAV